MKEATDCFLEVLSLKKKKKAKSAYKSHIHIMEHNTRIVTINYEDNAETANCFDIKVNGKKSE